MKIHSPFLFHSFPYGYLTVFEKTKPDYHVRFWLEEQYCGETIFKVCLVIPFVVLSDNQLQGINSITFFFLLYRVIPLRRG